MLKNKSDYPFRRSFLQFFLLLVIIPLYFSGQAQITASDKTKATFIYNFARTITWPDQEKLESFTIVVVGKKNKNLDSALRISVQNKMFNGKPFIVKSVKNIADIAEAQLIYVNGDDRFDQSRILRKIKGEGVLLVTENYSDFNKSMINFVNDRGKLRYSLNEALLKQEGFVCSESLLKLAVLTEKDWQDVYDKYKMLLASKDGKITVTKEDLEEMIETHEAQNQKIADAELKHEKSLEEIEKLSFEAQAQELKIRAQNDQIRRNKLETKNREQENELLKKEKLLHEAEANSQRTILILVVTALILILVFSVFVVRSWYLTRKQNTIIEAQKARVEQQKEIILMSKQTIEEKNKDITDSITYALRIQQAKLPPVESILTAFPESFILFQPKDIVSGDFYFFRKQYDSYYLAVGDCTGHGVPGAFMSLISMEKLEETLQTVESPAEILHHLNKAIKASLHQNDKDTSTRDGMDIATCRWDAKRKQLVYSGANRALWLIRKGEMELDEIKPTKKAIGGFTSDEQTFEEHTLQLEKGDTIYLFSDGYADTFNGKDGKKLTTRKFKELLLSIRDKSMQEQHAYLDTFIQNWKAGTEQVDDICILAIRF